MAQMNADRHRATVEQLASLEEPDFRDAVIYYLTKNRSPALFGAFTDPALLRRFKQTLFWLTKKAEKGDKPGNQVDRPFWADMKGLLRQEKRKLAYLIEHADTPHRRAYQQLIDKHRDEWQAMIDEAHDVARQTGQPVQKVSPRRLAQRHIREFLALRRAELVTAQNQGADQ